MSNKQGVMLLSNCEKNYDDEDCCKKEKQFHDHEFLGSTRLAELGDPDAHNHRFAGVSSPVILVEGGHVHRVKLRTDFFDYFHKFEAISGLPIPVGDGRHIHFVEAYNDFLYQYRKYLYEKEDLLIDLQIL